MDPRDQKNEMPSDDRLEQELESIREHLSAHGEQEPPALLDQAVLNAARRELAGRKRRPVRWIGAFATVSVLVLAVTLVVQQKQAPILPDSGTINGGRLSPVSENETGKEERGQSPASGNIDRVGGELRAKQDARQSSAKAVEAEPAKRKAESVLDPDKAPLASPPPPPMAATQELSADFRDAEATQPDPGDDAPATAAPSEKMDTEGNEQEAMAGQSQRGVEERLDEAAGTTPRSEPREQVVTEQDELKSNLEGPADWVKRMLKLRKDGEFEQLQLELEEFESAYPDYPLPPELTDFTG